MNERRRRIPWVGAIGAFLLFCSWFVQTKYSSELAEARRNMDGSITAISLAASAAEDWTARYFDLKAKPQPDRELVLAAAFKALQWNLVATKIAADRGAHDDWALALASGDDKRFRQASEVLLQRFEHGKLEALEADLATFIKLDNAARIRAQFDSAFGRRLIQVSKWKGLVDALVIFLYVVGSGFAIWDFFVRDSEPSDASVSS